MRFQVVVNGDEDNAVQYENASSAVNALIVARLADSVSDYRLDVFSEPNNVWVKLVTYKSERNNRTEE